MRRRRRTLRLAVCGAFSVILGAGVLGVFGDAGALAAERPSPTTQALRALVRQTNSLPGTVASTVRRRQLRRMAAHALRVARRQPCVAVRDLVRYRRVLARVKVKRGKRLPRSSHRLAALGPASLKASRLLLADRRTRRCGGGVKPSRRASSKATVLSSTVNGMRVRVELPELRFVPRIGGGRNWTQLVLPNTDAPGRPGTPGIPVVSGVFGVPEGARVVLGSVKTQSYSLAGVDVFPAQPEPVDADRPRPSFDKAPFAAKPFTIDRSAYRAKGPVPAKPAAGGTLGASRDIAIGDLRIPAAQYEPASRELKVLTSVQLDIRFEGGSQTFSEQLGSPWEHPQRTFAATLLNAAVVRLPIRDRVLRCGEEMLVITNTATRPAADTFATARRAAGIRTTVVETGAGTGQIGTTPAQIQAFIRGRLTQFGCIRPSYVTILGDDDLVPTFPGINGIPSDLQYSMRDDADELPDVAVGRIIGNDQAAVGTAVAKIVAYETTPPAGAWLNRATIAAQFQDDDANGQENRTFIQFAETVRNGLVSKLGVSADRVYGEHPGDNPQKFNDGTDLPAALKKPTFAWNGSGADVTTAWNQGRFLVVHRDHGWSDGWGTPGYNTGNVTALTNGAFLPVVMSINCSSAAYDYDETSFVGEALVNPNGGAVGAFGDTRDSPSWHNTQIALGFVDALLPRVLPAEGPALKQRVGNALIHGKLRLAGLAPPSGPGITGGDGSTRNELYLWHYFGDPSMQMWGGDGITLPPIADRALINAVFAAPPPGPDPPPYVVVVTLPAQFAGQPVSLLRDGQVVGKAVAGVGSVTIPASFGDGAVKPGDLRVAMDADGTLPVNVPVTGVPKGATTLTQTCPASISTNSGPPFEVKGKLQPGFAGATIRLVYRRPDGSTFPKTTTTDANGDWSLTIDPVAESQGHGTFGPWTVQSNFDGDAGYGASQSSVCTVVVND